MANVHLLLSAAPETVGAADLLGRLSARTSGRLLLAGPGLAWATPERLAEVPAGVEIAVCSQDARRAGWALEDAPQGVRWSSVATWLAELPAGDRLWTALP